MAQWTGSKLGKEYIKAVYCHLAYLTYMHNLFNLYAEDIMRNAGLVNYKLESRLPGEITVVSDMKMTPPLWEKTKN